MAKKQREYPHSRLGDIVNDSVSDPYVWLEEDSAERAAWIEAQNRYTNNRIRIIKGRSKIRKRLEELLLVDTVGDPSVRDDRIFFYKHRHDLQHAVLYMTDWPDGEERVLFDPNPLSDDGSIALAQTAITRDGKLMAYALNKNGSDWSHWRIMEVDTGNHFWDEFPRLAYTSFTWLRDKSGFFYSRSTHTDAQELTKTNLRVFFHELGTDWRDDKLIFGKGLKEEECPYVASISEDGKDVIFGISKGWSENELFHMDRSQENPQIVPITEGIRGIFGTVIKNGKLYIQTNVQAPNYRLCVVPLDGFVPQFDTWDTLVPEDKDAVLENFSVFDSRFFVSETRNVVNHVKEYTLEGKFVDEIKLPTLGSASVPYGREEMDAVFLGFGSFFHPTTTYKLNLKTRELTEFTRNDYPFDPSAFTSEQVWFKSKDGTEVPMFVVHRKDLELDGQNPTVLSGYGGFSYGEYPHFAASRMVWLENGGIIAVANLRGGDEFGEKWHEGGMLDKKQNVFDDFIAAGEALVGQNPSRLTGEETYSLRAYTSSGNLGIRGGSNGGLLVGAALVQRPDLWSAVSCEVPLLDMTKFHLTEGGVYWKSEYGNPDNPEHLAFILAYSPYHHVRDGEHYPAVIFQTALGDDRGVDPMHAMKMAAKVQAASVSDNPIYLQVLENTGHGHSKPMKMIINEFVDYYAFMGKHLRIKF